jgi:mRNA (2'-O-methyladenosine-N6-)-methyltransferase
MEKELALYLAEQHGQQESLPLDLSSFYRKLRRCSDRDKFRNLNTLASADDLAPAVLKFREHKLIDTDILHFGSKSLLMLTRTNLIALQRFIAQASWDPNKDVTEQTCEHPRRAVTKSDDAEMQKLASVSEGKSPKPRYTQQQDIAALLGKPTALEASAVAYFTKDAHSIREFCPHGTRMECDRRARMMSEPSSIGMATPLPSRTATNQRCMKLHFKPVIESHTDVSLGDCAYLSTCRRTRTCKYIHYEIEDTTSDKNNPVHRESESARRGVTPTPALPRTPRAPAQWVNVDVRNFDLSVLGKFPVIMADPPWEVRGMIYLRFGASVS